MTRSKAAILLRSNQYLSKGAWPIAQSTCSPATFPTPLHKRRYSSVAWLVIAANFLAHRSISSSLLCSNCGRRPNSHSCLLWRAAAIAPSETRHSFPLTVSSPFSCYLRSRIANLCIVNAELPWRSANCNRIVSKREKCRPKRDRHKVDAKLSFLNLSLVPRARKAARYVPCTNKLSRGTEDAIGLTADVSARPR